MGRLQLSLEFLCSPVCLRSLLPQHFNFFFNIGDLGGDSRGGNLRINRRVGSVVRRGGCDARSPACHRSYDRCGRGRGLPLGSPLGWHGCFQRACAYLKEMVVRGYVVSFALILDGCGFFVTQLLARFPQTAPTVVATRLDNELVAPPLGYMDQRGTHGTRNAQTRTRVRGSRDSWTPEPARRHEL